MVIALASSFVVRDVVGPEHRSPRTSAHHELRSHSSSSATTQFFTECVLSTIVPRAYPVVGSRWFGVPTREFGDMRCMACGGEMILIAVKPHDVGMVPGFRHETFQCSVCQDIERRFIFGRELRPVSVCPQPTVDS